MKTRDTSFLLTGLLVGFLSLFFYQKLVNTTPKESSSDQEKKHIRDKYRKILNENFKNKGILQGNSYLDSTSGDFIPFDTVKKKQDKFLQWRDYIYKIDTSYVQISRSYYIGKNKLRKLLKKMDKHNRKIKPNRNDSTLQGIYVNITMDSKIISPDSTLYYLDPVFIPVRGNGQLLYDYDTITDNNKNSFVRDHMSLNRSVPCPDVCP